MNGFYAHGHSQPTYLTCLSDLQASVTGRKPHPVRPGMFLETVSKVMSCRILYVEWFSLKPHRLRISWNCKIIGSVENFTLLILEGILTDSLWCFCPYSDLQIHFDYYSIIRRSHLSVLALLIDIFLFLPGLVWYICWSWFWHHSTTSGMGKFSHIIKSIDISVDKKEKSIDISISNIMCWLYISPWERYVSYFLS